MSTSFSGGGGDILIAWFKAIHALNSILTFLPIIYYEGLLKDYSAVWVCPSVTYKRKGTGDKREATTKDGAESEM